MISSACACGRHGVLDTAVEVVRITPSHSRFRLHIPRSDHGPTGPQRGARGHPRCGATGTLRHRNLPRGRGGLPGLFRSAIGPHALLLADSAGGVPAAPSQEAWRADRATSHARPQAPAGATTGPTSWAAAAHWRQVGSVLALLALASLHAWLGAPVSPARAEPAPSATARARSPSSLCARLLPEQDELWRAEVGHRG